MAYCSLSSVNGSDQFGSSIGPGGIGAMLCSATTCACKKLANSAAVRSTGVSVSARSVATTISSCEVAARATSTGTSAMWASLITRLPKAPGCGGMTMRSGRRSTAWRATVSRNGPTCTSTCCSGSMSPSAS